MSIFKKCFALFGVAVVFVCSLCIPAFASTETTGFSEPVFTDSNSVNVPYLYYEAEGGFYWLNGNLKGDYKGAMRHYSMTPEGFEVGDDISAPKYIVADSGFYFEQVYEEDNVYRLYVGGAATDQYYSLLDFDGTGYYTILMGSPCEWAYVKVTIPKSLLPGGKGSCYGYCRARILRGTVSGLWNGSNYLTFTDNIWVELHRESNELVMYYDCNGTSYSSVAEIYKDNLPAYDSSSLPAKFYMVMPSGVTFADIGVGSTVVFECNGKTVITAADFEQAADTAFQLEFVAKGVTPTETILGSITQLFRSVIRWVGSVASAAVDSTFFPFLAVGVGVGVFGIVFMYIRKMTFGA